MAIPSGSGTEIINRGWAEACTANGYTYFKWDGTESTSTTAAVPTNHIITLLNFILCEGSNATRVFSLQTYDGSTATSLLQSVSVGAYQTYVFNDRLVLKGGDTLRVHCATSSNFDLTFSFIDQDWT
jgi:hypothetical protein